MATSDYYFFTAPTGGTSHTTNDKILLVSGRLRYGILTLKMRYLVNKFWRAQAIFLRIWVN